MKNCSTQRRLPFLHSQELESFEREIKRRIERRVRQLREQVIPPSNTQRLKHGRHWQVVSSDQSDSPSELKSQCTETLLSMGRIVDHDTSALPEFLNDLPNQMHKQFMQMMYERLDQATQQTGNIVSGSDLKAAFPKMIELARFGVNRWGAATPPTLIVPPAMRNEIEQQESDPDPEYRAQIDALTEQKKAEATEEEARRVSRYKFE